MTVVSIDFETRSAADLTKVGAYRYAEHPTTRIICMYWAIGNEKPVAWWPWMEFPDRLRQHIFQGSAVNAWNAAFERVIWPIMVEQHGAPPVPLQQWRCTMVRAFLMGFPGKLDKAGPSMGLGVCKDDAGHRVMLQVSKPRRVYDISDANFSEAYEKAAYFQDTYLPEYELFEVEGRVKVAQWWVDEKRLLTLGDYCGTDVETERAAAQFLDKISPYELDGWQLDQRINDRGFYVDMDLVKAAKSMVKPATAAATKRLIHLTGDPRMSVTKPNSIREWLNKRLGLELDSIDKATLEMLKRELPALEHDELANEVIDLRLAAAKTSTAKLNALVNLANENSVVRGGLQYAGAGRTNRWCLAEGTEVLCRKVLTGEVLWMKIENVTTEYLVHDGDTWVAHDGVVNNGEREVMTYSGLTATPQHVVWVSSDQKMTLAEAQSRGLLIWKPDIPYTV